MHEPQSNRCYYIACIRRECVEAVDSLKLQRAHAALHEAKRVGYVQEIKLFQGGHTSLYNVQESTICDPKSCQKGVKYIII